MHPQAFQRDRIVEQIRTFFRGVHDISDFHYRLYLLHGICRECDGRGYLNSQSEVCPQCCASGSADRWHTAPAGGSEPAAD